MGCQIEHKTDAWSAGNLNFEKLTVITSFFFTFLKQIVYQFLLRKLTIIPSLFITFLTDCLPIPLPRIIGWPPPRHNFLKQFPANLNIRHTHEVRAVWNLTYSLNRLIAHLLTQNEWVTTIKTQRLEANFIQIEHRTDTHEVQEIWNMRNSRPQIRAAGPSQADSSSLAPKSSP